MSTAYELRLDVLERMFVRLEAPDRVRHAAKLMADLSTLDDDRRVVLGTRSGTLPRVTWHWTAEPWHAARVLRWIALGHEAHHLGVVLDDCGSGVDVPDLLLTLDYEWRQRHGGLR